MMIPVNDKHPQIGENCFVAPNATLVGDFRCGDFCSFWFNAVVRADVNSISMGHHSNIQDGAVIHCTYQQTETRIGNYVSIAHNAVVHGCTLEDEVMVGINAVVLDKALVSSGTLIAAGAVVLEGAKLEPNSVYAGTPAKKIKDISEVNQEMMQRIANNYTMYASWFQK